MTNTAYSVNPSYDVIVIGAGHAGCEAALAAARVGCRVLVLTPNLDRIGFMPCNPSIGGPAKGHIVAEIDALGGEMARAIDRTAIQIRKLNASKGPAVQALRAQADKRLYSLAMKEALEVQDNLEMRQEAATTITIDRSTSPPRVSSVQTDFGHEYRCGAAIITAGTFLRASMIAGTWSSEGGRSGEGSTVGLAASIGDVGIALRRLKTGTPPRVDARTIDFDLTEQQDGSDMPLWFSMDGRQDGVERLELPPHPIYRGRTSGWREQLSCYLVHTNERVHDHIRANVDRAPMYNGSIHGVGPRYCPSIEDKVMRFADKPAHGLFLEPEGWRTTEVYVQGANTSLPADVQTAMLREVPALRNVKITRFGYAVEYDAIEPTELTPWFAAKRVTGLYLAGQVNGTSGYEEAAGQGLLAGVNAARFLGGQDPLVLRRDQAYIGVMADDLTTQDFIEPYRMLTSRAEHRLMLRADNADERLSNIAFQAGLISSDRYQQIESERGLSEHVIERLESVHVNPNANTAAELAKCDLPPASRSQTAAEYARRSDVKLPQLLEALREIHPGVFDDVTADAHVLERTEIAIKYEAYVEKERRHISRIQEMEDARIPGSFDYATLPGLRNEAREKLQTVRPTTLGQASRIAGVTPSDLSVLMVRLKQRGDRPPKSASHHSPARAG